MRPTIETPDDDPEREFVVFGPYSVELDVPEDRLASMNDVQLDERSHQIDQIMQYSQSSVRRDNTDFLLPATVAAILLLWADFFPIVVMLAVFAFVTVILLRLFWQIRRSNTQIEIQKRLMKERRRQLAANSPETAAVFDEFDF